MIRIALICLLISLVETNDCVLSQNEIKGLKESLLTAASYIEVNVGDENAAICIGTARAGKSTLINYLIGNELIGFKISPYETMKIKRADNKTEGPVIGMGSTSTTKIPKKYSSKRLSNLAIWDSPGFDDNRGIIQDITNAFYIYELVKRVKSLKFILVIDFENLEQFDIAQFLKLLRALENFFGDKFKSIFSSISIIFSKASFIKDNDPSIPIGYTFLNYILNELFFSSTDLMISKDSKAFIKNIINHNERVAFFRTTEVEGPIPLNVTENIYTAIESTSSLDKNLLNGIGLTISEKSSICLQNSKDNLMPMTEMTNLHESIKIFFDDKDSELKNSSNKNITVIDKIRVNLTEMENILFDTPKNRLVLSERIKNLKIIGESVKKFIDNNDMIEKVKLLSFIDSILQINKTMNLEILVDAIYIYVYKRIKELIFITLLLVNKITEEEYVQKLREEIDDFNKKILDLQSQIQQMEKTANGKSWFEIFLSSYDNAFNVLH